MSGYWIEILTTSSINAIVAIGLYCQVASGQLSLAQAAFMGLGGYAAGLISARLGLPFELALVGGTLASMTVSGFFSFLVLRLSHFFYALATIAFGEAMVALATNLDVVGGALGFRGIPLATTRPLIFGSLAATILLAALFQNSRLMQGIRACGEDTEAAAASGCDARTLRVVASCISGALAGYGGALLAHYQGVIIPGDMSFALSLNYLVYVVVGGMHTFWGALFGSYLLTALPEVLRFSVADRYILYGLFLVVVVLLRPQGLIVRRPIGSSSPFLLLAASIACRLRNTVGAPEDREWVATSVKGKAQKG